MRHFIFMPLLLLLGLIGCIQTESMEPPQFHGGIDSLSLFISTNIIYPDEAREENIQGEVHVQFIVNKEGMVTEPTIVKSVDSLLDQAAIDVVNKMPAWKPGTKAGKNVSAVFLLPISFELEQ